MSHIVLKRVHGLGRRKAVKRLKELVAALHEEYEFEGTWKGQVLHLERGGATGLVQVSDDAVEIDVKLGLLLRPLRRTIEARIAARLDEIFPSVP